MHHIARVILLVELKVVAMLVADPPQACLKYCRGDAEADPLHGQVNQKHVHREL